MDCVCCRAHCAKQVSAFKVPERIFVTKVRATFWMLDEKVVNIWLREQTHLWLEQPFSSQIVSMLHGICLHKADSAQPPTRPLLCPHLHSLCLHSTSF